MAMVMAYMAMVMKVYAVSICCQNMFEHYWWETDGQIFMSLGCKSGSVYSAFFNCICMYYVNIIQNLIIIFVYTVMK